MVAAGTLVIGREQDCEGGCFDSMAGAAGHISASGNLQYGPQDFTGAVENMRVWKVGVLWLCEYSTCRCQCYQTWST